MLSAFMLSGLPALSCVAFKQRVQEQLSSEPARVGLSLVFDSGSFRVFLGDQAAVHADNLEQLADLNVKVSGAPD